MLSHSTSLKSGRVPPQNIMLHVPIIILHRNDKKYNCFYYHYCLLFIKQFQTLGSNSTF